jgi:hypothetical protein
MKTEFKVHEYGERKALELRFGDNVVSEWIPCFYGEFKRDLDIEGLSVTPARGFEAVCLYDCSIEDLKKLRDTITEALGEEKAAGQEEAARQLQKDEIRTIRMEKENYKSEEPNTPHLNDLRAMLKYVGVPLQ